MVLIVSGNRHIITFLSVNFTPHAGQIIAYSELVKGPQSISRYEGDKNVIIPCAYSRNTVPLWEINGFLYNKFSIPDGYSAHYKLGLLIPSVTVEMNQTTFRCHYKEDVGYPQKLSGTGVLTVYTP